MIVLAVGISTTAILIALLVALVRHLKVLSRSVRRFRDDVQPLLGDLSAGSGRARDRLAGISEAAQRLRSPRQRSGRPATGPGSSAEPGEGPGARIRS